MSEIKNGDLPANPIVDDCITQYTTEIYLGLTKREKFAAMAMQGLLSNTLIIDQCTDLSEKYLVEASASFADALLAELDKCKV